MKVVPSTQSLRYLRHLIRPASVSLSSAQPFLAAHRSQRHFHQSRPLRRTETHTLSDIGEGVKEVQIIQWFVEEGAQVEEWDPLCEVQSDKAAVEITSKFTGTIKKLHFKRDAIVQVGDAMVDIDVEGEDDASVDEGAPDTPEPQKQVQEGEQAAENTPEPKAQQETLPPDPVPAELPKPKGKHASLATPAVRGMLKEHSLKIENINGTGKDGRVMKEDVLNHINNAPSSTSPSASSSSSTVQTTHSGAGAGPQVETPQSLTPIQNAMFKSMTASLSIPHFLYTDSVNLTALSALRTRLNASLTSPDQPKISFLPFIIKAISLALRQYPLLNARLDTSTGRPQLQLRSQQNIGVAMDTPSGLMVPVIHAAQSLPIRALASHIASLSARARAGKLSTPDLTGGTITVSNIGNIGGEVVAPVLVEGQLAICGVGKIKDVPVFESDGRDDDGGEPQLVRAKMCQLSWSADHRVVDGATMARMAELVRRYLEEPGSMVVDMV